MAHMTDEYDFESNDDFLLLMPFGKAQRRNASHCATVRAVTPMRMACAPRVGPRAVMCPHTLDLAATRLIARSCRRVHAFARARARIWAELRAGRKPSAADLERWAGNAVSTVLAKRARQRGDGGARQRHFPDAPPVLPMRTRKPGHHQSEPFCFTAVMVTTGAYSSRQEADARKVISSATRS